MRVDSAAGSNAASSIPTWAFRQTPARSVRWPERSWPRPESLPQRPGLLFVPGVARQLSDGASRRGQMASFLEDLRGRMPKLLRGVVGAHERQGAQGSLAHALQAHSALSMTLVSSG